MDKDINSVEEIYNLIENITNPDEKQACLKGVLLMYNVLSEESKKEYSFDQSQFQRYLKAKKNEQEKSYR